MASKSRMAPLLRVARLFREHAVRIVTYLKHRFNNSIAEWVNRQIQDLIQKSCGYKNRERFKIDMLFHLGGLDLTRLQLYENPTIIPEAPCLYKSLLSGLKAYA